MTPDELRDELLRASLKFIRDHDLTDETIKQVHHAFWLADERLSELTTKRRKNNAAD